MYGRSENKKFPKNGKLISLVSEYLVWNVQIFHLDYEVHLSCAYDVNVDLCFFVLRISYLK